MAIKDVKEIVAKLKEAGFQLVRESKHFIYSNGERTICVPRTNVSPRTKKSILQQIEGKGPFFNKQQVHTEKTA